MLAPSGQEYRDSQHSRGSLPSLLLLHPSELSEEPSCSTSSSCKAQPKVNEIERSASLLRSFSRLLSLSPHLYLFGRTHLRTLLLLVDLRSLR